MKLGGGDDGYAIGEGDAASHLLQFGLEGREPVGFFEAEVFGSFEAGMYA